MTDTLTGLAPQHLNAERSLLAGTVKDNKAVPVAQAIIQPAHFYDKRHRQIWEIMVDLYSRERSIEYESVKAECQKAGLLNGQDSQDFLFNVLRHDDIEQPSTAKGCAELILDAYHEREGTTPDDETELFNLTDTGNAKLFHRNHGDVARYCVKKNKWFLFDDTRFKQDNDLSIYGLADQTIANLYSQAQQTADKSERKEAGKHALACEGLRRIKDMIIMAQHYCVSRMEDFDTDHMLLNVANGTVDLRTGELRDHSIDDMISKMSGTKYDEKAKCPQWLDHLQVVLKGNAELIDWFQRVVGYILTGKTYEQCLYLLYGSGNNGKSVTVNTIVSLLGEYSTATMAESFLKKRYEGGGINNDIAKMEGSRCVSVGEGIRGRSLNDDLVKALTGGDIISARFLRQEFSSFIPTFKILWSTNHLPIIGDQSISIWRRIKVIKFDVNIPADIVDPQIESKLKEELPGILQWAIDGCLKWQEKTLKPEPKVVTEAGGEYKNEEDPLRDFLQDLTVAGPNMEVQVTALYKAYQDHCEKAGERPLSNKRFGGLVTERGMKREKKKGQRVYTGIGLLTD